MWHHTLPLCPVHKHFYQFGLTTAKMTNQLAVPQQRPGQTTRGSQRPALTRTHLQRTAEAEGCREVAGGQGSAGKATGAEGR